MKLKPCPFCGNEVEYNLSLGYWPHFRIHGWVMCPKCDNVSQSIQWTRQIIEDHEIDTTNLDTIQSALENAVIELWNRRI